MTTRSKATKERAAAFARDAGLHLVPDEFRGLVVEAYLGWLDEVPVIAPGTTVRAKVTIPPLTPDPALPAEGAAVDPVEIEVVGRIEGRYVGEVRFLVMDMDQVPFEFRSRVGLADGWWDTGPCFVTVVSEAQVSPVQSVVEEWNPLNVVVRGAKAVTLGQEMADRARYDDDDDEEGTEWE